LERRVRSYDDRDAVDVLEELLDEKALPLSDA
jgi:hypothetical protein